MALSNALHLKAPPFAAESQFEIVHIPVRPLSVKKERTCQMIPDYKAGWSPSVTQLMVQCMQLTQFNFPSNLLMQITTYNMPFDEETGFFVHFFLLSFIFLLQLLLMWLMINYPFVIYRSSLFYFINDFKDMGFYMLAGVCNEMMHAGTQLGRHCFNCY